MEDVRFCEELKKISKTERLFPAITGKGTGLWLYRHCKLWKRQKRTLFWWFDSSGADFGCDSGWIDRNGVYFGRKGTGFHFQKIKCWKQKQNIRPDASPSIQKREGLFDFPLKGARFLDWENLNLERKNRIFLGIPLLL